MENIKLIVIIQCEIAKEDAVDFIVWIPFIKGIEHSAFIKKNRIYNI